MLEVQTDLFNRIDYTKVHVSRDIFAQKKLRKKNMPLTFFKKNLFKALVSIFFKLATLAPTTDSMKKEGGGDVLGSILTFYPRDSFDTLHLSDIKYWRCDENFINLAVF